MLSASGLCLALKHDWKLLFLYCSLFNIRNFCMTSKSSLSFQKHLYNNLTSQPGLSRSYFLIGRIKAGSGCGTGPDVAFCRIVSHRCPWSFAVSPSDAAEQLHLQESRLSFWTPAVRAGTRVKLIWMFVFPGAAAPVSDLIVRFRAPLPAAHFQGDFLCRWPWEWLRIIRLCSSL